MSVIDEVLKANDIYSRTHELRRLTPRPARKLAILTCMDTRLSIRTLGLMTGDAHIIRNAGGVVTDEHARVLRERLEDAPRVVTGPDGTRQWVVEGHPWSGVGWRGVANAACVPVMAGVGVRVFAVHARVVEQRIEVILLVNLRLFFRVTGPVVLAN